MSVLAKIGISKVEEAIWTAYYGLNGQIPSTFTEIGLNNKMSRERVRQFHSRMVGKIRRLFEKEDLKPEEKGVLLWLVEEDWLTGEMVLDLLGKMPDPTIKELPTSLIKKSLLSDNKEIRLRALKVAVRRKELQEG